jgi:hypothetical protein
MTWRVERQEKSLVGTNYIVYIDLLVLFLPNEIDFGQDILQVSVSSTIGNTEDVECKNISQIFSIGHSAKALVVECREENTLSTKILGNEGLCRVFFVTLSK